MGLTKFYAKSHLESTSNLMLNEKKLKRFRVKKGGQITLHLI
jgi:hypothetical protein